MKRRLLITGNKVQDIGYRMFLLNLASEHDLIGFQAKNLNRNAVEVEYEGPDESVLAFESDVREFIPEGAEVENIVFEDYDGPVKDIEKFRSYFTTLQLGKMIEVGLEMVRKQDLMLGKQDETLGELRAFRQESKQNQELIINELRAFRQESKQNQELIINELRGVRKDLKTMMDERLVKIERDLEAIKAKLGIG